MIISSAFIIVLHIGHLISRFSKLYNLITFLVIHEAQNFLLQHGTMVVN